MVDDVAVCLLAGSFAQGLVKAVLQSFFINEGDVLEGEVFDNVMLLRFLHIVPVTCSTLSSLSSSLLQEAREKAASNINMILQIFIVFSFVITYSFFVMDCLGALRCADNDYFCRNK